MIKNYLKTGFRNLFRHKGYAVINILGLGVGIASCLLISMFVRDEFTYDKYHSKLDSIYRLTTSSVSYDGTPSTIDAVSYPEAEAYFEEIPEIENFTRIRGEGAIVQVGEELFDEKGLIFSDKGLFEIFDFEVLDGALDAKLTDLESVVITKSTAIKYFGSVNVAGNELTVKVRDSFEQFTVTAVIEDHPSNSSFTFNMAMSWHKLKTIIDSWSMNQWGITPVSAYVLIDPAVDQTVVVDKIKQSRVLHNNDKEDGLQNRAFEGSNGLIALKNLHFEKRGGDQKKSQSYLLSGIAVLILIIACFNFSTLTIVNSISRAKEVGVRKTIGASRKHLIYQFLSEALILSIISFVLGIIMAEVSLPIFESLVEKQFSYNLLDDQMLIASVFLIVLVVSLLSVLYPSVYLSRLKVINVFRDRIKMGGKHILTKSMVTLQFLCAFIFITVAVSINEQHKYLMNKEKGYNDENLIRLSIPTANSDVIAQRFKNELGQNANILSIGAASDLNEAIAVKDTLGNQTFIIQGSVDMDYLKTLEIDLLEGRDFESADQAILDETNAALNVVLNKSTVGALGIDQPLGHTISDRKFRIIGVVDDYQVFSATSPMNSVMLMATTWPGRRFITNNIFIRYRANNLPDVLKTLETTWNKLLPFEPYQYTFVDEYNRNLYKKEALWSKTLTYSSSLSIVISLMGLLGLVGLSATQRRKEVSIRKVLGASITRLLLLLNQGFAGLLILSILISIPVAYLIIEDFLEGYINRIDITPLLFALPLIATFLVAVAIVSTVTLKTAKRNPVDELRNE